MQTIPLKRQCHEIFHLQFCPQTANSCPEDMPRNNFDSVRIFLEIIDPFLYFFSVNDTCKVCFASDIDTGKESLTGVNDTEK